MRASIVFISLVVLTALSGCGIKPKTLASPGFDFDGKPADGQPEDAKPKPFPRVYPDPSLN